MIEFENRVEYRSRANWRWCTESVRRNFHSVKSLCIPENSRCVEFFSFFLYFFPPFIHVGTAFTAIYRRPPPSWSRRRKHVRTRQAGAKRDTGRPISRQISRVNRFSTLARNARLYKRRRSSSIPSRGG